MRSNETDNRHITDGSNNLDRVLIFLSSIPLSRTGEFGHGGWQVILTMILCSFTAQSIKILAKLFKTGRLDLRMLARTGGMPSSHSCSAAGMATAVGFVAGFDSVLFAIAFCLAIIVMYDAAGVRRNVGLQGKVLNSMVEELFSEHPHLSSEKVKEFLGHSPFEVIVGAAMGAAISWLINQAILQL